MIEISPKIESPIKYTTEKKDIKYRKIVEFNPNEFTICTPKKITIKTGFLKKKNTILILHRTEDTFDWDVLHIKDNNIVHKKL